MKTKTRVRAGALIKNHNETLGRCDAAKGQGLKVKTHVRAGGVRGLNHNETLVIPSKALAPSTGGVPPYAPG